mmetsp:Transcript_45007/g.74574  ORF Transcript_45007/g.74574 Transcript_45007/m.74574 type:complete len:228 (-) Transcript_45007:28-711(-)
MIRFLVLERFVLRVQFAIRQRLRVQFRFQRRNHGLQLLNVFFLGGDHILGQRQPMFIALEMLRLAVARHQPRANRTLLILRHVVVRLILVQPRQLSAILRTMLTRLHLGARRLLNLFLLRLIFLQLQLGKFALQFDKLFLLLIVPALQLIEHRHRHLLLRLFRRQSLRQILILQFQRINLTQLFRHLLRRHFIALILVTPNRFNLSLAFLPNRTTLFADHFHLHFGA